MVEPCTLMPCSRSSQASCRVSFLKLGVRGARRLEPDPQPGDSQFDQFLHGVLADRVGGREHSQSPALARFFHAAQELHRAFAEQEEIFVHDEEGLHFEGVPRVASSL